MAAQPFKTQDGLDVSTALVVDPVTGKITDTSGYMTAGSMGIIRGTFSGTLAPFTGATRFYPPAKMIINSVYFSVGTTPASGGQVIIDVKVDGVSIFSNNALPTVNAGEYVSVTVQTSLTVDPTSYITVDILGASGGAQNATVFITY
jgi:hypothetical protein